MKKIRLIIIALSIIALAVILMITHTSATDDSLLKENIEAFAQGNEGGNTTVGEGWTVGCIKRPWGEGTPHTGCENKCEIVMADSWEESGYCVIH